MDALNIAVAGGGSWGTALAHVLAAGGHRVALMLRDAETARAVNERHENPRYLAGKRLHPSVTAYTAPEAASGRDIVVLAVPCQHLRGYLASLRPYLASNCILVNAAKGLEEHTCKPMSEVVRESLGDIFPRYAILSGPSFAAEVMDGRPAAVVLGCGDEELAVWLRHVFAAPFFRCYSSSDVIGVEIGGALKNVMAIAAGVCDGLELGANTRAALITRGLAELSRLGVSMGANPLTFMGLSGMGDLVLTCTGGLSRNRQVGLRLGRGERLEEIVASLGMVAEGVKTALAARRLAQATGVEAPITEAVCGILQDGVSPRDAVRALMARSLKEE